MDRCLFANSTSFLMIFNLLCVSALAASFFRFMPTVKARFDYGVTIFILTFSLVALSGYRVDDLIELTVERISTIGIGISITVSVCIIVCPVWSGRELHFLISRNLAKLAESLEGNYVSSLHSFVHSKFELRSVLELL